MTSTERRASFWLATIFALRMLGLFWIMPVFSIYAQSLPDGNNTQLVGLAIGIYGLSQSLFYILYGLASDRWGRKPVIVIGLIIFALGSWVAATAHTLPWIIVGRAIQGAGAISSALIALLADLTEEANRTKAMALIGASIGLSYAIAMITGPLLYHALGMSGLFALMGVLALLAIVVVLRWIPSPTEQAQKNSASRVNLRSAFTAVLSHAELLRLNLGVFILHATQTALFVIFPRLLVNTGLTLESHWKIYLPVMGLSFVFMVPAIIIAEKYRKMKSVFFFAISCIALSQLLFAELAPTLPFLASGLLIYFIGFNVLEASQPSLVSKFAPKEYKGAAMGVYNTTQALGLFSGGVLGGYLLHHFSVNAIFFVCASMAVLWLIIASPMRAPLIELKSKAPTHF